MSKPCPPDDSQNRSAPLIDGLEAFERAMRIKLEDNRRARASQASGKLPQSGERSVTDDVNSPEAEERLGRKRLRERYERTQPSEPSAPLVEPGSAEEPDQAILDDLPKLPNPIPVLIDEHHTVLVYTLIDADPEWTPPFPCWPPHTARDRMVASLNRGENFHGNLIEEFYVTANNSYDASHLVLWMGDDGSQNNDDRPHLIPVAYVDLDDFSVYDDLDQFASAVLLCAWIRAAQEAWGDDWYETDTDCCGGEMPDDLVEELLRLACSKDALRLNRNGRPWAALKASEVSAPPSEPWRSWIRHR